MRSDTNTHFQPNPTTTDSGIVPHQTAAQEIYLLDIIAIGSLDASNGIAKANATKQSVNWDRWGNIPQKLRNHRLIPGRDPKRAEENPCVIIRRLSATKPVRHNQETNTPPRNCQVRHIGCICVLLDAPSERPDPRVLKSKILNTTATTQGLKNARPNNQTPERYTIKSSPPHLQADNHTPEHSHWSTDYRRIFLRHAVMQVLYYS